LTVSVDATDVGCAASLNAGAACGGGCGSKGATGYGAGA